MDVNFTITQTSPVNFAIAAILNDVLFSSIDTMTINENASYGHFETQTI